MISPLESTSHQSRPGHRRKKGKNKNENSYILNNMTRPSSMVFFFFSLRCLLDLFIFYDARNFIGATVRLSDCTIQWSLDKRKIGEQAHGSDYNLHTLRYVYALRASTALRSTIHCPRNFEFHRRFSDALSLHARCTI